MEDTSRDPRVVALLRIGAVRSVLNTMLDRLDRCQKSLNEFLEEIEVIFTVIFTGECLMRIVALGFVAHPNAYLRNTWNILDFTIVMIGSVPL